MDNYDVKTIRESMRMTQEQFADLLGVSVRTIGNWESGASIPATKIIMKFTGHSSFAAMKPYIAIVNELKEKAMERFNDI